ncbi:Rne/Rng family ribonuclease [Actinobacteria bacterium YIM 96077]|uniref:Ribonuclease E n=1 Tax=Phytoactinopolyspora halophila TaxID=1981511 RepID=A0A329R4S6_9ACTN|nr:Rne/Rng family ribonuclease [Phytoactinopolyspora halophila]AYY12235.1 Rne/Rng family ribonuclease [Actinobacteria bacterium YIM 96077]RAW18532.1 ribonuclease E/G [Phytoactinopolyspora halophila]
MQEDNATSAEGSAESIDSASRRTSRKRAASRPSGPPAAEAAGETATGEGADVDDTAQQTAPAKKSPAKKSTARKKAPGKTTSVTSDASGTPEKTTSKKAGTKSARGNDAAQSAPDKDAAQSVPAGDTESVPDSDATESAPAKKAPAKKAPAKKTPAKKAPAKKSAPKKKQGSPKGQAEDKTTGPAVEAADETGPGADSGANTETRADAGIGTDTGAAAATQEPAPRADSGVQDTAAQDPDGRHDGGEDDGSTALFRAPAFDAMPIFEPPRPPEPSPRDESAPTAPAAEPADTDVPDTVAAGENERGSDDDSDDGSDDDGSGRRRRRRRGGRGRRKKPESGVSADGGTEQGGDEPAESAQAGNTGSTDAPEADDTGDDASDESAESDENSDGQEGSGGSRRRRRRRRRKSEGETEDGRTDDPPNTVVKVRDQREADDEVTLVKGSTRLEAKKQRRREGREAGRKRAPILTESEFLARREAVDRVMAVRQKGDVTQIAVLEDDVLVEHYVSRASQQSMIGNIYLGRVQNVLPAMEAAFIDIGRGRNAVVYAGEIDWAALGHADGPKRIEEVLKSGQTTLVQVTKDPMGHKGARLTGQISLPGRYVVYVPGGSMSGISRKLPDSERNRLKKILKKVVPEDAGVIVRTAAEGASEEELINDVERLQAEWSKIQQKTSGSAPALLHGEPDLAIKVVRDLFNEDFTKLVVSGNEAWKSIDSYVSSVASSLRDRLEKWTSNEDLFAALRIDEQITKALDRKVWLPSGGSLMIDRTEAMTVIDVNTGKFTGSGGNLEETVTRNNLEAAEEIVRQLRLRDIGGIIVVDFIDMVLESNRDLVLRRLVECLGRDRTKHQVAEVTSLGLVQMTRKRIGTGLIEAFSEQCPHCKGRGLTLHTHPAEATKSSSDESTSRSERRGRRRRNEQQEKADVSLAPKLEANADPGEASPADLVPVSDEEGQAQAASGAETQPSADAKPAADAESAAGPQSASGAQPAEAASDENTSANSSANSSGNGAQPTSRRGRRRARRPAGSPDEHATAQAS